MDIFIDALKWVGIVSAAFLVAGALAVAAMAWLLNQPIDEDEPGRGARGF